MLAGAAIGAVITIATSSEPGLALGVPLIAGTVIAVLAVRPASAYLIIPMPVLAYAAAASVAGLVHDRAIDTSLAALGTSALQWAARGFIATVAATAAAIVLAAARWMTSARGADSRPSAG